MAATAKNLKQTTSSPGPHRHRERGSQDAMPQTRSLAKDIRAADRRRATRKASRAARAPSVERKAQALSSVQIVGSILLIFAMACGVVAGRAMVADLGYELIRLESQLEQARGRTDTLSSHVAALQDPERIAVVAEDIGMIPVALAREPGEENAPAVATIASTTASMANPELRTGDASRRAAPSTDRLPSRIVLELEDTEEPAMQLAAFRGLGDWILRWLKGSTPVETHNQRVGR